VLVQLEGPPGGVPDDYLEMGPIALISPRFSERVQDVGAGSVQLFPAVIQLSYRTTQSGYAVMNVVGRLDCFDEERSRLRRRKGALVKVETLVMAPALPFELPLFVPHLLPDLLIVSSEVADRLAGLSGCRLTPLEQWRL
jgi:hypothetical protein